MRYAGAMFSTCYAPFALVTGAGSGIGAAFACEAVRRGVPVWLVDIDGDGLERTAARCAELAPALAAPRTSCGDLSDMAFVEQLEQDGAAEVGLLVHNAGISRVGAFLDVELEHHLTVLRLHCEAVLRLTHSVGRAMRDRGRGGIVLVSSRSAPMHSPMVAHYAATKSWLWCLGEALWAELEPHGVDVIACLPGMTPTPGLDRAGHNGGGGVMLMDAERVVSRTLDALGRAPSISPNPLDRLTGAALAMLPRKTALRLNRSQMSSFFPHLDDE